MSQRRDRSGDRHLKNAFAENFRDVRAAVLGPGERRRMLDAPRSGAVEAIVGGASPEHLSPAMGEALSASNAPYQTYVTVQMVTVLNVAGARRKGRRKLRGQNGS